MTENTKTPKPARSRRSSKTIAYYEGTGRRKSAIARVRVFATKKGSVMIGDTTYTGGTFLVENKDIKQVFNEQALQILCRRPLTVLEVDDQYVVFVKVRGGGNVSQTGAISLGLARALSQIPSADLREKLRAEDLMTRDSRTRERRMVGTGGKSRRLKQSPKR